MKIAMLSDSVLTPTGYGNVTLELLSRLTEKGHECYNLAHNYHGQDLKKTVFADGKEINFTIIGAGLQPYFADRLAPMINKYKFDVLIVLLDTFMMKGSPAQQGWFERFDFTPCKTIFYFPSDGRKFPLSCEHILHKVDLPIAMAKFGQEQVKEQFNIDALHIPHAIDKTLFFPEDKNECKAMFGFRPEHFIVGVVARNQGRKMLDRTIKAFYEFAKDKEDVFLLMHTDPHDSAQVFDLSSLIKEYKLENKVRFTGMKAFSGFTLQKLRKVYNCFDAFFLTTSGEGFGIPTIEAMACEVPVVLTDYTSSAELTDNGKCGLLVPVATEITGTWNVERACMDIEEGAKALQYLYDNPDKRIEMGKKGREFVLWNYEWTDVANEWDCVLTRLIE